MKSHGRFSKITVFGVLASGLILLLAASVSSAEGQQAATQYVVVRLGTLGGTMGRSNSVNDRGWVSGWWNLPGDTNHHAVLWIDGQANDLGTLGGPSSEIEYIATNDFGMLAGGSDTSNIDPYGENFCIINDTSNNELPDQFECSAFRWENGVMSALPGMGGNSSYAANSNRLGHIVGWAETALDPTCLAPQVFDFHGTLWSGGRVHDLPPLPGDTSSAAIAINDQEVAAGGSGICASPGALGFAVLTHAVIWRNGLPADLGGLGGQFNNAATDSNNSGQVVGLSDLARRYHHARRPMAERGDQRSWYAPGRHLQLCMGDQRGRQDFRPIVRRQWKLPRLSLEKRSDDRRQHAHPG
jgi:uncharacterized membrane protein